MFGRSHFETEEACSGYLCKNKWLEGSQHQTHFSGLLKEKKPGPHKKRPRPPLGCLSKAGSSPPHGRLPPILQRRCRLLCRETFSYYHPLSYSGLYKPSIVPWQATFRSFIICDDAPTRYSSRPQMFIPQGGSTLSLFFLTGTRRLRLTIAAGRCSSPHSKEKTNCQ